jgi:hypothetical protein
LDFRALRPLDAVFMIVHGRGKAAAFSLPCLFGHAYPQTKITQMESLVKGLFPKIDFILGK